jgi:hypothetical protein
MAAPPRRGLEFEVEHRGDARLEIAHHLVQVLARIERVDHQLVAVELRAQGARQHADDIRQRDPADAGGQAQAMAHEAGMQRHAGPQCAPRDVDRARQ